MLREGLLLELRLFSQIHIPILPIVKMQLEGWQALTLPRTP